MNKQERLHKALGRVPATREELEQYKEEIQTVTQDAVNSMQDMFVKLSWLIEKAENLTDTVKKSKENLDILGEEIKTYSEIIYNLNRKVEGIHNIVKFHDAYIHKQPGLFSNEEQKNEEARNS